MSEDFDELLVAGFLSPPPDFGDRVMARVAELPLPWLVVSRSRRSEKIQWIALIAAGLAAAAQLVTFTFGIWSVTVAG